MKLIVAVVLTTTSLSMAAENLVLSVQPPETAIHVGDSPRFAVTISNRGSNAVTLVLPGDGSDCGWRTPVVGWSILPAYAPEQKHPEKPHPLEGFRRCGNINHLKLNEVFSLKPGESRDLGVWIGSPKFERPGRFRLLFYYQNIPDLKITGLPLGQHEHGALDQLRQSTPCRLISEEITVDVLPKSP